MRTRHARPLYALRTSHPPNGLTAIWGVARPQVFLPLGYPLPYGPGGQDGLDKALKYHSNFSGVTRKVFNVTSTLGLFNGADSNYHMIPYLST
jgi:hypothetical protein